MKNRKIVKLAILVVTIAIAVVVCAFNINNNKSNYDTVNITYDDTLDLDKEVYSDSKADSDDSADSFDTLDLHKEVYSNSKAE